MKQSKLRAHLATLGLYQHLLDDVLPALSAGAPGEAGFDLVFVGRSDVRQASYEVAVLTCASSREVAVVWLPNTLFRKDGGHERDAELTVHVYPVDVVVVSTSSVVHDVGTKDALILVLPDGQTQSGTREVRIAITDESQAVGAAARALRGLAA